MEQCWHVIAPQFLPKEVEEITFEKTQDLLFWSFQEAKAPSDADVSIAVTLAPAMEFTATYPIVPVQQLHPTGQKIQWDVRTGTDGTLVELETGLELSSLFWEAELSPRHPVLSPSRPDPHEKAGSFDVEKWDLSDWDSVVLPVEEVTAYLQKALKRLGLHTEARTSFITFWLPSFLNHHHIALRFIPQTDYSRLAPLDITPEPDVVTRVFMLFKGVLDPEAWPSARRRALDDVAGWADIVGVDAEAAFNKDFSRVLEWGAMEIPP
ncbi:hypothetical protein Hypma_008608 [Hypsizygus marmoreus]|uniref:Uncharacterized protein n=1 Tax=Hypsizygus marmoreus TaxID=39966 RepID=A0A369JZC5_HYPMA|nr:hypothetical protein Hypma_008608 [Hypsizygus marmoreus]